MNSNFKRSNDYGYSNTSFFESQIGFTGMADLAESWKLIPQIEVENDSHGMYKNSHYSREEKDYVNLHFTNEYTPTPSRWTFNFGGAHFMHRLVPEGMGFVKGQGFYKADGQIGWEYGWSAAVRAKLNVKAGFYDYSTEADNDTYVTADLIGSFKMTEYVVISLGPTYCWNRDDTHFAGGRGSISTVNMKHLTMELAYTYDLKPFEPEALYKLQKFVYPAFNLPPSKQQKGECKFAVEWKNDSESPVHVSGLKIRVSGTYEKLSDYYNMHMSEEYLVYPGVMALYCARGKGEFTMDIKAGEDSGIRLGAGYEYNHYRASRRVTYKPEYAATATMKIRIQRLGIDWNNTLMGSVYVDPYSSEKLGRSLIGSVMLSVRILESFYLYGKVDNVYGERYHYRYGYPEPGRLFLGGLRIQI
ncbi:MAG: hypothetical protein JXA20_05960 [Spirochaetes bacterium]|nr:hypothetical protein [Spirochaetota bacterium]